MELQWTLKPFNELTLKELYDSLALRQMVFSVEQNCAYLDTDYKDQSGHHLLGYNPENNQLWAYARILPLGVAYPNAASIGRVITHKDARGTGSGKKLMEISIPTLYNLYGEKTPIRISAQQYLEKFYGSYGFKIASAPYLEDDIWHVEMVKD